MRYSTGGTPTVDGILHPEQVEPSSVRWLCRRLGAVAQATIERVQAMVGLVIDR